MNLLEIKKRKNYIIQRLKMLKMAIESYKTSTIEFEKYKSLKTVERECEEIIESATRINQEILTEIGELGETYRNSFEKLYTIGLFDKKKELLEKLANTTGFRDRIAHDYMDLNEEITIKSAENILSLYPLYLIEIIESLKIYKNYIII